MYRPGHELKVQGLGLRGREYANVESALDLQREYSRICRCSPGCRLPWSACGNRRRRRQHGRRTRPPVRCATQSTSAAACRSVCSQCAPFAGGMRSCLVDEQGRVSNSMPRRTGVLKHILTGLSRSAAPAVPGQRAEPQAAAAGAAASAAAAAGDGRRAPRRELRASARAAAATAGAGGVPRSPRSQVSARRSGHGRTQDQEASSLQSVRFLVRA